MMGLIRGYPISHSTAPLLRTGLVHRWQWPGPVPRQQAEVVILGGTGAAKVGTAVVPGPLLQVLMVQG